MSESQTGATGDHAERFDWMKFTLDAINEILHATRRALDKHFEHEARLAEAGQQANRIQHTFAAVPISEPERVTVVLDGGVCITGMATLEWTDDTDDTVIVTIKPDQHA